MAWGTSISPTPRKPVTQSCCGLRCVQTGKGSCSFCISARLAKQTTHPATTRCYEDQIIHHSLSHSLTHSILSFHLRFAHSRPYTCAASIAYLIDSLTDQLQTEHCFCAARPVSASHRPPCFTHARSPSLRHPARLLSGLFLYLFPRPVQAMKFSLLAVASALACLASAQVSGGVPSCAVSCLPYSLAIVSSTC